MAHKAEILAPCGSFETLEAALRSGCDAVYLGGEKFSARQNAVNFTDEQLKEAVRLCHLRGVKVYQAINTVVFDEQLEECKKAVKFAAEIGVDGLITQDLTLVKICRECCPPRYSPPAIHADCCHHESRAARSWPNEYGS